MTENFKIQVCSLPGYDQLVAEIYVDGAYIGLLSQEGGPDETMLELWGDGQSRAKIRLALFEDAVTAAKARIAELRKG